MQFVWTTPGKGSHHFPASQRGSPGIESAILARRVAGASRRVGAVAGAQCDVWPTWGNHASVAGVRIAKILNSIGNIDCGQGSLASPRLSYR
jgi:hypothetical protein